LPSGVGPAAAKLGGAARTARRGGVGAKNFTLKSEKVVWLIDSSVGEAVRMICC
jgi:hypothetical protein